MSKLKKIFIVLLVIILTYFLVIGITSMIRMSVLNKILKKANNNIEKDNYSLKTTCVNGEYKSETTAYYRDGIGRYVAENGIYTWTDGQKAYMVDEENKTLYVLTISKSSEMLISNDMFAYLIPGYNLSFIDKLKLCGNMFNKFSTEKIGDEDYYKITVNEEKYVKTTWISKKSLSPSKAIMEFPSGDPLEYTYDLRFTATKLSSIDLPNLDTYKIIDYETGEVIVEKFTTEETVESNDTKETNTVTNND